MNEMGMSVIAWGFSYQVKDKPSASQVSSKATKFYCDFKFRSATFNEGYVGRDIIVGMTKTAGRRKTIPERFSNFIKLTANNWRLNGKRTLTVPEINSLLNRHQNDEFDVQENRDKYFGVFAQCPNRPVNCSESELPNRIFRIGTSDNN